MEALLITHDKIEYKIQTIHSKSVARNEPEVTSKTGGRTFRTAGNRDVSWHIWLEDKKPKSSALAAGQIVTVKSKDATSKKMIIDVMEEGYYHPSGAVSDGIRLTCAAYNENSY